MENYSNLTLDNKNIIYNFNNNYNNYYNKFSFKFLFFNSLNLIFSTSSRRLCNLSFLFFCFLIFLGEIFFVKIIEYYEQNYHNFFYFDHNSPSIDSSSNFSNSTDLNLTSSYSGVSSSTTYSRIVSSPSTSPSNSPSSSSKLYYTPYNSITPSTHIFPLIPFRFHILKSINRNSLYVFLFSNILTGLTNLTLIPIRRNTYESVIILIFYIFSFSSFTLILDSMKKKYIKQL